MRGAILVSLCLVPACGRVGFGDRALDAGGDGSLGIAKPDASLADADPTIDSPLGVGTYQVSDTTAPYTSPANATLVPGFVPDADDDVYTVALPFPFTFYGITYTNVTISANGFVTFGAPPTGTEAYLNDCPFDATPPDATIAVFWDDLYSPAAAPAGTIKTAIGQTTFTIEWANSDAYYQAGSGNNSFSQGMRATQQLVLHQNGVIDLHYGPRTVPKDNKDCGLDRHLGCSATVGLEAPGSTVRQTVQCGTAAGPLPGYAPLVDGRLITFTPL